MPHPFHRSLIALVVIGLVACGFCESAQAQTGAPQPTCTAGDTLRWILTPPPAGCGALTSVEVYGAELRNGAYSRIADQAGGGTGFIVLDPATADATEFLYLVGIYAGCGPSAPSDTVPTGQLTAPAIQDIVFDESGTLLRWEQPANDVRVAGYIVYRETETTPEPIDTVYGSTRYLDPYNPDEPGSVLYYLAPIDTCNSTAFNSDAYSSATVSPTRDACGGTLTLSRRLARDWPRPLVRTVIIRETEEGVIDSVEVNEADATLVIADLPPTTGYSVVVRYIDDAGGSTTAFPESLPSIDLVVEDSIEIAEVTFEAEEWRLRWRWNPEANYEDASFEVRRGSEVVTNGTLQPGLATSVAPTVQLGLGADFDWSNAIVQVQATDECGKLRRSGTARPPILSASSAGDLNILTEWTLPHPDSIATTSWTLRLLETVGSTALETFSAGSGTLSYSHNVGAIDSREICYQLTAEVELADVFDRGIADYTWRSAPACAARPARVYLATGFAPEGGVTSEYRPRTSLLGGLDYSFKVYDRWGTIVFETEDPLVAWDGSIRGGSPAPPGAYVAVVVLDGATDGEAAQGPTRYEATVALLR